jgi:hypothetical protein
MVSPRTELSIQNKVPLPLPTIMDIEALKNAYTMG